MVRPHVEIQKIGDVAVQHAITEIAGRAAEYEDQRKAAEPGGFADCSEYHGHRQNDQQLRRRQQRFPKPGRGVGEKAERHARVSHVYQREEAVDHRTGAAVWQPRRHCTLRELVRHEDRQPDPKQAQVSA